MLLSQGNVDSSHVSYLAQTRKPGPVILLMLDVGLGLIRSRPKSTTQFFIRVRVPPNLAANTIRL
jgi:hypothetical protein